MAKPDRKVLLQNAIEVTSPLRSWKLLVQDVVEKQPRHFTLADVLRYEDELRAAYPLNRFVGAKIRQSLQVLRDQGVLRFHGGGRYERLDAPATFSPLIDATLAEGYSSRAQIARIVIETWAEMNLYCLRCTRDALARLPANTPVADFACISCDARYQLKAKDGRIGSTLIGASYATTIGAVREGAMPAYILAEFDGRRASVVYADALPGSLIDEPRIIARKPLSPNARRAGWQGCIINVDGIPRVPIVEPAGADRADVRRRWGELHPS